MCCAVKKDVPEVVELRDLVPQQALARLAPQLAVGGEESLNALPQFLFLGLVIYQLT